MHRLVALAKGCLAAACLLALGCASRPAIQSPAPLAYSTASATASVGAGPPACSTLHARIVGSEEQDAVRSGTWLDSPLRMVEGRRLRALQARATEIGCTPPRI